MVWRSSRALYLLVPVSALLIGLWLMHEYAWVLDDAFIYFRYADNAALLDRGLTYNAGEYVEGFTSPLWMLLLVVARAAGSAYWPLIVALGAGSLIACWLISVRCDRGLGGGSASHLPAIFFATNYAVLSHFTSGLETPFVQLSAAIFGYLVLYPSSRTAQVFLGLAPLVRPELGAAVAIAWLWSWWSTRRFPWYLTASAALAILGWEAFRVYYYADFLPNTYYLKDGSRVAYGWIYLNDTMRAYGLGALSGAFGLVVLVLVVRRGPRTLRLAPRLVMWLAVIVHTAYVVRIGGDFVHYRYLAFPVCLLIFSFGGLIDLLVGVRTFFGRYVATAAGIAAGYFWILSYPPQLDHHPLTIIPSNDALQRYGDQNIEDAARHRSIRYVLGDGFDLDPAVWDVPPEQIVARAGSLPYGQVFTSGWCAHAYLHMDAYIVHAFGLTDPIIARLDSQWDEPHAGHRWRIAVFARDVRWLRVHSAAAAAMGGAMTESLGFDAAGELSPDASSWMRRHQDALRRIEAKAYNQHHFSSNLRIALEGAISIPVLESDAEEALQRPE